MVHLQAELLVLFLRHWRVESARGRTTHRAQSKKVRWPTSYVTLKGLAVHRTPGNQTMVQVCNYSSKTEELGMIPVRMDHDLFRERIGSPISRLSLRSICS